MADQTPNPLDDLYSQLLGQGMTTDQIAAATVDLFIKQGTTPAALAQLALDRERIKREQVESQVPDITQTLTADELAAFWTWLMDGNGEEDYVVPLAKALQAARDKNLNSFARHACGVFKAMRRRTPHLEVQQ